MGTQYIDWDTNWTDTGITTPITVGSTQTTAAISLDQKIAAAVSVEITNGASNVSGAIVRILSDVDGSDFEAAADIPARAYQLPSTSSATFRRTFSIPATDYPSFKVSVENPSGNANSMTSVTVRYKLAVVTTA